MRVLLVSLVALLAALPLIMAQPKAAFACTCAPLSHDPARVASMLKRAPGVIVGRVVAIELMDYSIEMEFDVERSYGAPVSDRVMVTTRADGAACGYGHLPIGTSHFLVLGAPQQPDKAMYNINSCSSFAMSSLRGGDGRYLEDRRAFLAEVERQSQLVEIETTPGLDALTLPVEDGTDGGGFDWWVWAAAAALPLVAFGATIAMRRLRREP